MPERNRASRAGPKGAPPPVGQQQDTSTSPVAASPGKRLAPRRCLRKGCNKVFQPRRWNQRYCQEQQCMQQLRRWQAAKRQQRHRAKLENRQRHQQAERRRRRQQRAQRSARSPGTVSSGGKPPPPTIRGATGAWSRRRKISADFCDRPGCYEPRRPCCNSQARYCSDDCRQAVQRVHDRERKWRSRKTYGGRFKRRLEYERARGRRQRWYRSVASVKVAEFSDAVLDSSGSQGQAVPYQSLQEPSHDPQTHPGDRPRAPPSS